MKVFFFILPFLFCSCSDSLQPNEYIKWVNDPGNGLVKSKEVAGLKIEVKLMPNEYLVYKDIKTQKLVYSNDVRDSLMNNYKNGTAFLFTLGPSAKNGKDIMMENVRDKESFNKRVLDMNFNIEQYITLQIGDKEVSPLIVSLDNIYGLKNERSVYVLFDNIMDHHKQAQKFTFVYNDKIFNTGTSKFLFLKEDILSVPKISYSSIK